MQQHHHQNSVIPEEMDYVNVENSDTEVNIEQQEMTDTTINVDVNDKIEEPNMGSINVDSMYSARGANITNLTNDDNFNASPPKY